MKTDRNEKSLCLTVGDLIVAITDVALKLYGSERQAYRFTGRVLNKVLQPAPVVAVRPQIYFRGRSRLR